MGREKVNPFFEDEYTHTSAAGAEFNAESVVMGLKQLPNNPLALAEVNGARSTKRRLPACHYTGI